MPLSKRDVIATALVAVAAVVYFSWAAGSALPGLSGVRATGAVVLALGFLASASAVVPTFVTLLHGGKVYLATTSVMGLVAAVAGVQVLVNSSETSLAVLMWMMIALWLVTTIHHSLLARSDQPSPTGSAGVTREREAPLAGVR